MLLLIGLMLWAEILAQEAVVEIEVPTMSDRDFFRMQKRAAIMESASQKNKADSSTSEAAQGQVRAAVEQLLPGRDYHYFASTAEREEFQRRWEQWSSADEEARGPEPVPVLHTFRYYASPEEEDAQERAARLLRVIVDREAFPAIDSWNEEQWVSGALLFNVERPLRMEAANLDDVPITLFDVILCTRGAGEAVSRLFHQSKTYGQDVSGQNVGVFDFSTVCGEQEWMKDASFFFMSAYCPEVQKKYHEKSFWIPRGYHTFTPWRPETLPPASERGYLYVVEYEHNLKNEAVHTLRGAQLPSEFTTHELVASKKLQDDPVERILYLREAAFVPCVSEAVHCVFDALQNGAIPITDDALSAGEAAAGFGRVPYPRVRSWKEVPPLMRYFAKRPQELNSLQDAVIAWWDAYQTSLAFRINQLLDIRFGDFQLAYFE